MDIFGKKRISELELALEKSNKERKEYKLLSDVYNNTIEKLNDDVKKLTDEINAKVENCTVGAWCEGCKYCKTARLANDEEHKKFAKQGAYFFYGSLYNYYYYCSKHLREICPEFDKMKED